MAMTPKFCEALLSSMSATEGIDSVSVGILKKNRFYRRQLM